MENLFSAIAKLYNFQKCIRTKGKRLFSCFSNQLLWLYKFHICMPCRKSFLVKTSWKFRTGLEIKCFFMCSLEFTHLKLLLKGEFTLKFYHFVPVAATGLSERGSSFSAYIIKLSIYLKVNSALRSFSRKWSVTLSYQLGVFSSDLTSVLSMASRARLLKRPWPIVFRV